MKIDMNFCVTWWCPTSEKNEINGQIFAEHRLQNKNRNETDIENYRHVEIVQKNQIHSILWTYRAKKKHTRYSCSQSIAT